MGDNPLGRQTEYPRHYDPSVLFPVARAVNREKLPGGGAPPFSGEDRWHGYELSWLDTGGMPAAAVLRLTVPQESPCLIESKSLKLYLNSLNQTSFDSVQALQQRIRDDLSRVAGAAVSVQILSPGKAAVDESVLRGSTCLERQSVEPGAWQPDASLLRCDRSRHAEEALHSHLFRSCCPITGQPDWGSVVVRYEGPALDHDGLLRYLLSYREHQGYHEDCVERIYTDLWQCCEPRWLVVGIQFLRRGGLDINPWRWSGECPPDALPAAGIRLARQ